MKVMEMIKYNLQFLKKRRNELKASKKINLTIICEIINSSQSRNVIKKNIGFDPDK